MKQSHLFGQTRRETAKGEVSKNAILLTRGGYIDKELAGIYTLLPLGFLVAENVKKIVREELQKLSRWQEMLMPAMQPHALWEESGRREAIKEIMYDIKDESLGLGPTHEEVVTDLFRRLVHSYKDLPLAVYQIQTKFRNEPRAKSGLLRGREFMMKDLYSFHLTEEDLDSYYNEVKDAYLHIFKRCGLDAVVTEASGGVFSKFSHEFQVVSESGEDEIYINQAGTLAKNKEIVDELDPGLLEFSGGKINKRSAIEVGNIFKLNRKFSEPMKATVATKDGATTPVWMGCYGIGITRLVGTLVEIYGNLEKASIKWPQSVAPFKIHLIEIGQGLGQALYNQLAELDQCGQSGILYDDRDSTPGAKFADADLVGAPIRIVISKRTLEQDSVEFSSVIASPELAERTRQSVLVKQSELLDKLSTL